MLLLARIHKTSATLPQKRRRPRHREGAEDSGRCPDWVRTIDIPFILKSLGSKGEEESLNGHDQDAFPVLIPHLGHCSNITPNDTKKTANKHSKRTMDRIDGHGHSGCPLVGNCEGDSNRKARDSDNVIHGGRGHDERWDILLNSVAFLLELKHSANDDRRRDGGEDEAEREAEDEAHSKNKHRKDSDHEGLEYSRHDRQAHGGHASLLDKLNIQLEATAHEDDGQSEGDDIGRPVIGKAVKRLVDAPRRIAVVDAGLCEVPTRVANRAAIGVFVVVATSRVGYDIFQENPREKVAEQPWHADLGHCLTAERATHPNKYDRSPLGQHWVLGRAC
mmetsp:Transcript_52957/g.105241  ORF Transcript_52957/g.105241 Transcript_52957/m.105241 type:complete len:334 (+) Transcript_52957:932-1933(+)